MRLSRRSFLGALAAAPVAARLAPIAAAETVVAPVAAMPGVLLTGNSVVTGSAITCASVPKLLWPGLNAMWAHDFNAVAANG